MINIGTSSKKRHRYFVPKAHPRSLEVARGGGGGGVGLGGRLGRRVRVDVNEEVQLL